jgi:threonine synthase
MLRTIKIGAIVALTSVVGNQASGTETLTWGIFRENAPNVSESQRNCWAQAMVSGSTINGELMVQHLTQDKAETELQKLAKRGQCAAERTSLSWSARGQGQNDAGGSSGGSNANGSGSDWSNDGGSDTDADRSHAGRR